MTNDEKILKILEQQGKALESLQADMKGLQSGQALEADVATIKRDMATKQDVEASEKRLKQAILDSQEDTIETLKEYIHTGYNMHDERIEKIEDALDLPHPDKN